MHVPHQLLPISNRREGLEMPPSNLREIGVWYVEFGSSVVGWSSAGPEICRRRWLVKTIHTRANCAKFYANPVSGRAFASPCINVCLGRVVQCSLVTSYSTLFAASSKFGGSKKPKAMLRRRWTMRLSYGYRKLGHQTISCGSGQSTNPRSCFKKA